LAEPTQAGSGLAGSTEPDPLPGLPRPPEQPNTLFQAAPATQPYACCDLECPYFEKDPFLDPDCLPHPGWVFDAEMDLLGTHVVDRIGLTNPTTSPAVTGVNVPMARLNWTASPRFEAGYRLPSGFGEIDVSYRFLLTQGIGTLPAGTVLPSSGVVAPLGTAAALTSHFDLNTGDVDYASVETSLSMLGPNGPLMKWRIGLRTADLLFTSAVGGTSYNISDNYWGIGPHAALELQTQANPWGLSLVSKLDGGLLFGQSHQQFATVAPTGTADFKNWEQSPTLSGFLGLDWRPAGHPNLDLLLGYTAEYWWNIGRMSDPDIYNSASAGEVGIQGAALRLEFNY
jgi:hypothetical protein